MSVLVLLLLVPAFQVWTLVWSNPETTGTMVQRYVEAKLTQKTIPWRMYWTSSQQVPQSFFRFVWVAEDQRFFMHDGFDWIELQKAWENTADGEGRGASTITMQCARTIFLWQGRSWFRKALEAYYTVWMECFLSKERILELYVNVVELGDGIYGVGRASRHYFKRNPVQLSIKEQALLVAMLPNPRHSNPLQPNSSLSNHQQTILFRASNAEFPKELESIGKK